MGFQQGIAAMNTMGRIGTQKLPTSKTSGINSNFFYTTIHFETLWVVE